ncbi:2-oxoglutarate dehydrogenase, mitochondrial [Toxocara canis]|uniref:2-oxoglutarate dehydrogenase, mitochondrial n=1 Tax=Toxocara canis TaxID=6265 RepID=A0A0B2V5L5_TOXCA|nr:2-oxoglutarate dehydrogenase, mitochondrial [Toxocara canis]
MLRTRVPIRICRPLYLDGRVRLCSKDLTSSAHRTRYSEPSWNVSRSISSSAAIFNRQEHANTISGVYAQQMYEAWQRDPQSVHSSWDIYFRNSENGTADLPSSSKIVEHRAAPFADEIGALARSWDASLKDINDHLKIQLLIDSFQVSYFHCSLTYEVMTYEISKLYFTNISISSKF